MIQSNSEDKANGCGLKNWTKCIMKVHTGLLMKSFGYKTSFVFEDRAIRITFNSKHPFATVRLLA